MPTWYRPPVDPGYGRLGSSIQAALLGGLNAAAAVRGQRADDEEQRLALRERILARKQAEEDAKLRRATQMAELGVIGEDEAYETAPPPPVAQAITGWNSGVALPAAAVPTPERVLRPGVRQVGSLFIDPTRSLAYERAIATRRAQEQAETEERERRAAAARTALTAAGITGAPLERAVAAAILGREVPETIEERVARVRAEEQAREPFRSADDERTFERSMALVAARGGGDGGMTPAQQRAARNETRREARETAETFLRQNPRATAQQAQAFIARESMGFGEMLSAQELANIASDAEVGVRGTLSTQGRAPRGDAAPAEGAGQPEHSTPQRLPAQRARPPGRRATTVQADTTRRQRPSAEARARQLRGQGKTPQEVLRTLRQEGY